MARKITRRVASSSAMGLTIGTAFPESGFAAGPRLNSLEGPRSVKDEEVPWYKRTMAGIEVGPSETHAKDPMFYSRASDKTIVRNLLEAKVEYAVIFMKDCDFAYYDSKVMCKCPSLGQRDLLREILESRIAGANFTLGGSTRNRPKVLL